MRKAGSSWNFPRFSTTLELGIEALFHRSTMRNLPHSGWALMALALASAAHVLLAAEPAVRHGDDGKLIYASDDRGNRVPDFSRCGYAGADRDIPEVQAVVSATPADGDDTASIQAAIDEVAKRPLDADGFRGVVELSPGEFQVAGQLRITTSGVVLRGAGAGEGGTTIVATGPDRRTLVRVFGTAKREFIGWPTRIADKYVPVGATRVKLNSADHLRVGDTITITRPSTAEWIKVIGANAFGVGWRPGSRDIVWERIVTAIDGDSISIDAPITTAIDQESEELKEGNVQKWQIMGRIENVGVEDLRLVSQPTMDRPLDEDHAWHGVSIENAQNAWVRRVEFRGFAGGAVALWESTKWVTVEDCISLAPVSEVGGFRRHTFFTQGEMTLFLRCWSELGRHEFAVGHCAAGPNAFVNCRTRESLADSGPLESWASGVLYDNVRIDGNALNLMNRWTDPPGTGWSAANCVLWQCRAATIACFRPPTANNWAIGCWAAFAGDGTIESPSDFVRPLSLYQAQLQERVGDTAAKRIDPILGEPIGATNPTLEEAATFVAESREPAKELVDVIRERMNEHTKRGRDLGLGTGDLESQKIPNPNLQSPAPSLQPPKNRLTIHNGWLVADGKLVAGGRFDPLWWRGNVRPDEVQQLGQAITRFVPGRIGTGFTDDLVQVADDMRQRGEVAYDHHYGLWYDRRRDDHTMGRQKNGDVAAPFYEQPFARTGDTAKHGTAWDGLSKYDLTQFNPWYWNRLHDFARLCDERGLVLLHQNYFQHNILEAGAHWADSPWRPANNVNDTQLPEPPPYIGDKRQFMAPAFYEPSNEKLRALHRDYIRQCLDAFADTSNVIQMTSAEYSGPLEFTQFWLDAIADWKKEQGAGSRGQGVNAADSVLVALSAPKDVQDAILADPERAMHVDVIDIRYWAYTAGDGLYTPKGGQNLAPRQHLRQTKLKPGGAAAIVKAVREYRERFPDKVVIYNADENCPSTHDGWAALIAGGSLADVRLPPGLAAIIPSMRPVDGITNGGAAHGDAWCLANGLGEFVVYSPTQGESIELNLPAGRYAVKSITRSDGTVASKTEISVDGPISLPAESGIVWLSRQE